MFRVEQHPRHTLATNWNCKQCAIPADKQTPRPAIRISRAHLPSLALQMDLLRMFFFDNFSASMARLDKGLSPRDAFERFHFATLDWRVPVVAVLLYVTIVTLWGRCNAARAARVASVAKRGESAPLLKTRKGQATVVHKRPSFTPFNCLVIAHNVLLTVFSAYCLICILPILVKSYATRSLFDAYCDTGAKDYYAGINYLVWLFYISKYYELLDTVILLVKGKSSSFLQTFHHAGTIIGLWSMVTTRIPGVWVFVAFNSFIHTIMYSYYTLTCLGYQPSWKKLLTTMQIMQFVVGNTLAIIYCSLPSCLPSNGSVRENVLAKVIGSHYGSMLFTFLYNFLFVGTLIMLFNDFSKRTYGPKDTGSAKRGQKPRAVTKKVEAEPSKNVVEKESARQGKTVAARGRTAAVATKKAEPRRRSPRRGAE